MDFLSKMETEAAKIDTLGVVLYQLDAILHTHRLTMNSPVFVKYLTPL